MIRALVALALLAAFAQGCAVGEAEVAPRAEICSPTHEGEPCASARVGVAYRAAIWSHCGVEWSYFGGRFWVVDPPQPEGSNELHGLMTLLERDERLIFDVDDGRRYAFEPAPDSYAPPPCL